MVRSTTFSKNTWATSQASGSWTPELWECHFTTTKDKVLVTLSLPGKVKWCSGQFLKVREVAASLDLTAKHMCIEASPFLCPRRTPGTRPDPDPWAWPCLESCSWHPWQLLPLHRWKPKTHLPTMAWKDSYENRKNKKLKTKKLMPGSKV